MNFTSVDKYWGYDSGVRESHFEPPEWYKRIYDNKTFYYIDICENNKNEYILYLPALLRDSYYNMFGADYNFSDLRTAKQRVDLFLDKLIKLKAFL